MTTLRKLFEKNRNWADRITARDPQFFRKLSHLQAPDYLWIGCADSRVPANEIVGLLPGEMFVHRNIANMVVHTDLNCLSVMQFAVDVLKVHHIIVVGHYGCGGVRAALQKKRLGLIDNWLRHIQDVHAKHAKSIASLHQLSAKIDRLCEINVIEQVRNVCQTSIVLDAWERGQKLTVHGWVYGLNDGLIRDLGVSMNRPEGIDKKLPARDRGPVTMRLSHESETTRRLAIVAVCLLAAWLLTMHARSVRDYLNLVGQLGLRGQVEAPTPLKMIFPTFATDAQVWVRHSLSLLEGHELRLRHTDIDNALEGREVHWNLRVGVDHRGLGQALPGHERRNARSGGREGNDLAWAHDAPLAHRAGLDVDLAAGRGAGGRFHRRRDGAA